MLRRLDPVTGDEQQLDGQVIDDSFGFSSQMRGLLQIMEAKGALMVTGGGNDDARVPVLGWPQTFALENPILEPLLVAGAISLDGQQIKYAQSPQQGVPHVFAPGIDVLVADGQPAALAEGLEANKYRRASGTSMCKLFCSLPSYSQWAMLMD